MLLSLGDIWIEEKETYVKRRPFVRVKNRVRTARAFYAIGFVWTNASRIWSDTKLWPLKRHIPCLYRRASLGSKRVQRLVHPRRPRGSHWGRGKVETTEKPSAKKKLSSRSGGEVRRISAIFVSQCLWYLLVGSLVPAWIMFSPQFSCGQYAGTLATYAVV